MSDTWLSRAFAGIHRSGICHFDEREGMPSCV